jgi:uncharacterized membrane protein
MRALFWVPLAAICSIVGIFPLVYLLAEGKIGILQTKSDALVVDPWWRMGFHAHITCGGITLLAGWTQFVNSWRERYRKLHRAVGKFYILMVCVSGSAGVFIAPLATTGWIAGMGFGCLGMIWLYVTFKAYQRVRQGDIEGHQRMMVYSYSACCAAVTLRLWLPLLLGLLRLDFSYAYPLVAWLCWVPNLLVARSINASRAKRCQDSFPGKES